MKIRSLVIFLLTLGGAANVYAETLPLDQWVQEQKPRAILRLRDAISPSDSPRGSVFASPSRADPDYYYHWIRDAALVMREIYELRSSDPDTANRLLREFITFSRGVQQAPAEGEAIYGLGEPKFNMNGTVYSKSWSRPQNDGPALRAYLIAQYAMNLWAEGQQDYVKREIYRAELPANTLLKADLEYVSHHWSESSYDLWEESKGDHFYTRMAQWRALEVGAVLARLLSDGDAASFYEMQAALILKSLGDFWSPKGSFLNVTIHNTGGIDYKTSRIDSAIVLAIIELGKATGPYSIRDEKVMQSILAIEDRFKALYQINRQTRTLDGLELGVAIGRYPEDKYTGYGSDGEGNPWFLATMAMAEYYYRLSAEVLAEPSFILADRYRPFLGRLTGLSVRQSSPDQIALSLKTRADAFLRRAQYHAGDSGHLSEQFSRNDGSVQGARDLTWSYAAFLSAVRARSTLMSSIKFLGLNPQNQKPSSGRRK